jgi:hypothetical protein
LYWPRTTPSPAGGSDVASFSLLAPLDTWSGKDRTNPNHAQPRPGNIVHRDRTIQLKIWHQRTLRRHTCAPHRQSLRIKLRMKNTCPSQMAAGESNPHRSPNFSHLFLFRCPLHSRVIQIPGLSRRLSCIASSRRVLLTWKASAAAVGVRTRRDACVLLVAKHIRALAGWWDALDDTCGALHCRCHGKKFFAWVIAMYRVGLSPIDPPLC